MSGGSRGGRWRRNRGRDAANPPPAPVETPAPLFVNAPDVETLPHVEPKIPWAPIALVAIALLWIPIALSPERDPIRGTEVPWVPAIRGQVEFVANEGLERSFSRELTRRAVEWEAGARGLQEWALAESGVPLRLAAARRPSTIAALLLLLVYFVLGRRMIGSAAALVATALFAISPPFLEGARSAHPLLIAEALALAGVAWMIGIEARHREVGFTPTSALEATGAGILFGAAFVEHPATLPTALAALVLWLSLGLRRSHAVTLPERQPGTSAAFAWIGAAGLAGTAFLTMLGLDRIAGASTLSFVTSIPIPSAAAIWEDAYRWMVSPVGGTDLLVLAAALLVLGIAYAERSFGMLWRGAGMLPWIYLLLFVSIVAGIGFSSSRPPIGSATAGTGPMPSWPELPLPIPSLFILGLGWLVLRGFSPGRVRRQEYTFLLVWLALGVVLLPLGVAWDARLTGQGESASIPIVAMTILPMIVLVAARAARAFWESEPTLLARIGILGFACLPIVASLVVSFLRLATPPGTATLPDPFEPHLPIALGFAAALGAFALLVSVRPDRPSAAARHSGGPRRDRGPRRGRGRGRPPRGRRPRTNR